MAAAVVVVITISRVLEVRPPAVGPAKLASLEQGAARECFSALLLVCHRAPDPWHFFHFLPEPQVQGSLRPRTASSRA